MVFPLKMVDLSIVFCYSLPGRVIRTSQAHLAETSPWSMAGGLEVAAAPGCSLAIRWVTTGTTKELR
jgi:hypothetical protein